jgi:hypothetical protein
MMHAPEPDAGLSSSLLTPEEIASRDALAREVGRGSMMTVMPVPYAEVGNRILEATRELLHDHGFLVVVIEGGSEDAVQAAWWLTAAARIEASRKSVLRPTVLIVKDAHLLSSDDLNLLAQAGDLAVVAAPLEMRRALPGMTSRHRLRIASIVAAPVLALLALGVFSWPAVQRHVSDVTAIQVPTGHGADARGSQSGIASASPSDPGTSDNARLRVKPAAEAAVALSAEAAATLVPTPSAPGLLLKAKPGDTLETLYLRVYRGVTPPPFASVAALNPEHVRPGAILIFPEPVNGWARHEP